MSEFNIEAYQSFNEDGQPLFDEKRMTRDFELTQLVQNGYTPAENLPGRRKPTITDGTLDEKGQHALGMLWQHYQSAAKGLANSFLGRVYTRPSIEIDDLINEAYFGLYHAAIKWHPNKRITFLTQASSYMRQRMERYILAHESAVRVPVDVRESIRSLGAVSWRSYQTSGQFPNRSQLADMFNTNKAMVEDLQKTEALTYQMGSIENGYFEDDRDRKSIMDAGTGRWKPVYPKGSEELDVDQEALLNELAAAVRLLMTNSGRHSQDRNFYLSDREVELLKMRFFERLTLEEAGRRLGVTSERARQMESRTFARLRHPHVAEILHGFLAA